MSPLNEPSKNFGRYTYTFVHAKSLLMANPNSIVRMTDNSNSSKSISVSKPLSGLNTSYAQLIELWKKSTVNLNVILQKLHGFDF